MNDEETVALIAGGHTFGKTHGAGDPSHVGAEPEGGAIEEQGLGWKSTHETGIGAARHHQRPRSHLDADADEVEQRLLRPPVQVRVGADQEPGRRAPVEARRGAGAARSPMRYDPSKKRAPTMLTTDLALRIDPVYEKISRRFYENPDQFADAFARAWFKLTHRDMGPISRYLGPLVPKETLIWQDPVPAGDHPLVDEQDIAALKAKILASGLSVPQLVSTAWASASTFRGTDKRGGANGARIRLAPQKDWEVNEPAELARLLAKLEAIQKDFNASAKGGKKISLADLIVLGGGAAIEKAAKNAGIDVKVPFTPGRMDASQEQTDVESFGVLEPAAGRLPQLSRGAGSHAPEEAAGRQGAAAQADRAGNDRAGRRHARAGRQRRQSKHGVFTKTPGTLTNDFFVNLLDMGTEWKPSKARRTSSKAATARRARSSGPHARRSRLRLEFAAARACRGLWVLRTRRRSSCRTSSSVDQGDEPRSLRPRLQERAGAQDRGGVSWPPPLPGADLRKRGPRGKDSRAALAPFYALRRDKPCAEICIAPRRTAFVAPLGRESRSAAGLRRRREPRRVYWDAVRKGRDGGTSGECENRRYS